MSAPTNHWKLGLFVVSGIGLFLAVLVFLGARSFDKETVTYHTYFDESVQGLDVGSPVKFRGVTLGSVSAIGVAPDRRHVEIACALVVSQLVSLKLVDTAPKKLALPFGHKPTVTLAVPADLRMQLGSAGITGVKYISLDFFDVKDDPPPDLPFPAGENYVPAAPSMMKSLEDSLVKAVSRFPEITEQLLGVVSHINHLMTAVDDEKLPQQASVTLARASAVLASLQLMLKQANVGQLSHDTSGMIGGLAHAINDLDAMLAKMDGKEGLIASAQRATDSMGDLAGGAKGLGSELSDTLQGMREAAESLQRLTDALDTDSDMLLKGRAKGRP